MPTITIAQLNYASLQVNRYLSVALLIFGVIGNLLSCLVFIRRALRSNPCVMYFLIASIANIISLISGIPPRMLSNWNIYPDQTETISALCKSRIFVLLTARNIASWLLVFAAFDRYLVSSRNANIRRMSNTKQGRYWIIAVCIISLSFWAESLYCFDANVIGTPLKCYAKSESCRIYNDLTQSFITTIIPSSIMFILGLFTINNIRQTRQVRPSTIGGTPIRRKSKTYCFDANVIGTPLKCYAKSESCRIYNDLTQSFITTIIPSSIMFILGLFTINNIRQTRQVRPSTIGGTPIRRKSKTDSSLTKMLLLQVILLTVFNLPQAIQKFYLTYTFYHIKPAFQVALENFLFSIVLLLTYIPNCISFYLYILAGDLFRTTLFQIIQTFIRRLKCSLN
ncbi:unnamed protein product [Adineta steineri]|uniref:G-protein coupled receptors family 1 profile domain-containing protein n=1 Tax=Adineta steineri TaxID=433720 RepID=A0A814WIK8_9BILA|nr:unnamed protein product [Adineta steineri]